MGTVAAGFAIVWLVVVAYISWIGHRQRRLASEYEALRTERLAGADAEDIARSAA